jgi:hypothetical protein
MYNMALLMRGLVFIFLLVSRNPRLLDGPVKRRRYHLHVDGTSRHYYWDYEGRLSRAPRCHKPPLG